MSNELLYISDAELAAEAADGIIRKQVLPRNKVYRWPGQTGKVLHITDEVLKQVVANFKSRIIDTVPFFKVNDKNAHTEDPENVRGTVVDLVETEEGLDALIRPINDEAKKQILASNLGASAGLALSYSTHDTGKNVGAVMRHIAWTPEPWIPGMKPFAEVSLSGETFEAVFLAEEKTGNNEESADGGEKHMDPKELETAVAKAVDEALAPMKDELTSTKDALKTANETIAALTTTINEKASTATAEQVKMELAGMVEAGLPPAIADLAAPLLLETSEVHLSSGDTSTTAAQMREILALIPKVDFSEKGEAGIPEGAVVVLSAEQVKALGFTPPEKGEGDVELSEDETLIDSVVNLIPKELRKEA